MPKIPNSLLYTEDHEWVSVEGKLILLGITDHAQDQLGDIVYLGEFPKIGEVVDQGDAIGVIESVKATSDIFSPVSGKVVEINVDLLDSPEQINGDPYGESWMLKIRMEEPEELEDLFSSERYEQMIEE